MCSKKIRILIADDDEDFCYLIYEILRDVEEIEVVGHCLNCADAIKLAFNQAVDIVLMDLQLPISPSNDEWISTQVDVPSTSYEIKLEGIQAAKKIRIGTEAKVIILTSFEDSSIVINASMQSFASGYILKSHFNSIKETILETCEGHSPQEYFIISMIFSKLTYAEKSVTKNILGINEELLSAGKTIANQKTSIFNKLGVGNTKEVIHIFKEYRDLLSCLDDKKH